jgi:penicillin-binding protein activator
VNRIRMAAIILVALALLLPGCASRKVVSRVDARETIDLSGNWNDTDSRQVADEMIADALGRPWLMNHVKDNGKNPAIIVGSIKNLTDEHIPTGTFVGDIERAFVNSGNVRVVATQSQREGIRDERQDQQANASPESVKKFGQELGADYMLMGQINKITDEANRDKTFFYQVDLTLTNIQTNEKVWLGDKKIKKFISTAPYKP